MIPLEEFKKALGILAEELSEEQILQVREQQDQMAEAFLSSWLDEINQVKN